MVFHWSLSDSKSPHVSSTLLSMGTDLNNNVVWMVSTRPLTSMSSSPYTNPFVTVLSTPITNDISVTFKFNSFLKSLRSHLSLSFLFVLPCGQPEWQRTLYSRFSFFVDYHKVIWPRLNDPFVFKIAKDLKVSFSKTDSGLCINYLFEWSSLNFFWGCFFLLSEDIQFLSKGFLFFAFSRVRFRLQEVA